LQQCVGGLANDKGSPIHFQRRSLMDALRR
jgi:hypothetical protein